MRQHDGKGTSGEEERFQQISGSRGQDGKENRADDG